MDGPDASDRRGRRPGLRRFLPAPITRRILAVNIFALAVLVVGLLYVGQYRQELIQREVVAMGAQAELFAAALGEAAVDTGASAETHLLAGPARQIIRRLAATVGARARLVAAGGGLVADSRRLLGPGGAVVVEELPPPEPEGGTMRGFLALVDRVVGLIDGGGTPPDAKAGRPVGELAETRRALGGDADFAVHAQARGRLELSVATPVQRYKRVLGALVLTKGTEKIDEAVFQVRLDILKVFAVALSVTVLLSVYLAGTIARPLHRLAQAAEQVRRGLARRYALPDFHRRRDEIGDLARVLDDMTEALWRRMDAIESFAADVAHEIKNPLTSLQSAVETAARIDDAEQQRKLMTIIAEDVARLDRLISDISDASRIDAELSRGELELVNLGDLLAVLVEIHDATDNAGGVALVLKRPPDDSAGDPLRVLGMADRLVQVFRNLLANALSFSPPGGTIAIDARGDDGYVTIQLTDQGPGIADGMEETVFERFYRDRPRAEKFATHSGLGLSISKQIVEAHGGEIRAANRVDENGAVKGARFTVRLPRASKVPDR